MPGFAPSTRLATHEVSNQPAEFGGINLFDIDLALKEAALRERYGSFDHPGARSGCSSSVNKPIGTRRSLPLSTATAGALTRCASTPLGTS